jgi:acetyl-CoA C-acetyltransferase
MNFDDPIVLVSGARTAIGRFGGSLAGVEASDMGSACIREALSRANVDPEEVDEVVMGQVGQVGPDAYNARRSALGAGIPTSATAMNVNRLCASGLQAIVTGAQQLLLDCARVVVAGGDESMSRQPFLDYTSRAGARLGNRTVLDGTLSLVTDPFGRYPMGETAERVAERYHVSREEQDQCAFRSQQRAAQAIDDGAFDEQIVPIEVADGKSFSRDEHPRSTTLEALAQLPPAFRDSGTVTAGNAAGINDGAAAVVMMRASEARRRKIDPRLTLRGWAVTGIDPDIMGYAPAQSIPKVLERSSLTLADIDVVELNEAFAAQAVAVARDVDIPTEKLNPWGGAIALGHPVGATGTILAIKLMYGLERVGGVRGIASMCIGGGQGMAAVFDSMN